MDVRDTEMHAEIKPEKGPAGNQSSGQAAKLGRQPYKPMVLLQPPKQTVEVGTRPLNPPLALAEHLSAMKDTQSSRWPRPPEESYGCSLLPELMCSGAKEEDQRFYYHSNQERHSPLSCYT
ncbi:hypothetical protein Anapl_13268 [Anas platyrhynchos]|uniref:Uncharacterized protein n=1 Tax=Anas platyrhynchos TaxID=8839 RepID=R0JN33_ANAPL|nr:hypothetical protein Anapl_13268 [Anas platyrhynchos]